MSSPPTTQEKKDHIFLSTHPPSKACTWYLKRFEEEDSALRKVHRACGGYEGCLYEWRPPPSPWSSCPPHLVTPLGSLLMILQKAIGSYGRFMSESSSACQSATPVFLPGESQGRGSLVGCRLWGRTESGHDWSDLAQHRNKRSPGFSGSFPLSGFLLPFVHSTNKEVTWPQ